jgi:hypothetical protein
VQQVGHSSNQTYLEDAAMTWVVLAGFVLVFVVPSLARRRDRFFNISRPAPTVSMGVEGSRKLGKKTRAALDAATAMLR